MPKPRIVILAGPNGAGKAIASKDERIRASMAKAIKEVRRHAAINKIKLVVAGKRDWDIPK